MRRCPLRVERIAYAELVASLARRHRAGGLSTEALDSILARVDPDFRSLLVVELRPALFARVPALVRRHSLRGYDAVQLAAALTLRDRGAVSLWGADGDLLAAAAAEGLQIVKV